MKKYTALLLVLMMLTIYIPNMPSALAVESPGIDLALTDGITDINVGDSFDVDVKFNDLGMALTGIKLSIGYDASKLSLDTVTYQAPFAGWMSLPGDQVIEDNKVRLEKVNLSEVAVNNESIATLHFTALEAGNQIPIEFIDDAGAPNGVGLTNNDNASGIPQSEYTIGSSLEVNAVNEHGSIDLTLIDGITDINVGDSFDVDVKFNDLGMSLTGIKLSIGYDASKLSLDTVTYQAPFAGWMSLPGDQVIEDNKVRLEKVNLSEVAVNNESIATLHFTALEAGNQIPIGFIDDAGAPNGVGLANNDNASGIPQSEYGIGQAVNVNVQGVAVVKDIVSVETLVDIQVANGTTFGNLLLPTTVEVALDDTTTTNLDVTWATGTYDGNTAGTYALEGTLTLLDGITNTGGLKAAINVIVEEPIIIPKNIQNVWPLADINVQQGTTLTELNLPDTAQVTLDDLTVESLVVQWNSGVPVYDGDTAGTYIFTGTLTLNDSLTNTLNKAAEIHVIVEEPVTDLILKAAKVRNSTGKVIDLPINLENVTNVAGGNFDVVFDQNLVSVGEGAVTTPIEGMTLIPNYNDVQNGILKIGFMKTDDITEDGELINIQFTLNGDNGNSTEIGLQNVQLNDGEAPLPVVVKDGLIDIGYKYGDVNNSGSITALDATLALRASVGLITLDGQEAIAADIDGYTGITSLDAVMILRYAVKLRESFPVEYK